MASFFNLPFSVRIAGKDPIDGDRYLAATTVERDALIAAGRAKAGQQVFVESEKKLYILTGPTIADWVEVGAGISGGDANYIHTQVATQAQWNVTHNLGKRPSVTVSTDSGSIVEAEVTYIDDNSVRVEFNAPFAGIAIFN